MFQELSRNAILFFKESSFEIHLHYAHDVSPSVHIYFDRVRDILVFSMSKRKLPEGETTERVARHASRRDAPPAAVRDLTGEQVDPRARRKVEKATVDCLYDYVEIPLAAEAAGGAGTAAAGAAAGADAEAETLRYPVLNVFKAWEALARESPDFQRLLQAKAAGGSLGLRFSVYGDARQPVGAGQPAKGVLLLLQRTRVRGVPPLRTVLVRAHRCAHCHHEDRQGRTVWLCAMFVRPPAISAAGCQYPAWRKSALRAWFCVALLV